MEDGKYIIRVKARDTNRGSKVAFSDRFETQNHKKFEKYVDHCKRKGRNYTYYLDVPGDYKVYEWGYIKHEDRKAMDDGTYIDKANNRLVIKTRLDGKWWRKAKYRATYWVYTRKVVSKANTKAFAKEEDVVKIPEKSQEVIAPLTKKAIPVVMLMKENNLIRQGAKANKSLDREQKIPLMIKDVTEELTTVKVKLSFDSDKIKIEDVSAPVFEDINIRLEKKIDNQQGKIEIEAVIIEEADVSQEEKGSNMNRISFAKAINDEEEDEENIAPIAYLIINAPQRAKTISSQDALNEPMNWIRIDDVELKDADENIIVATIENRDIVKVNSYEANLDKAYCYPNPTGNQITFTKLTKKIKITVYNVAGELIYGEIEHQSDTNGEWTWDCKNNAGEKIDSGIYIYILQDPESRSVTQGKLGIIR